ncbi:p49 [Euproctis pseudoconspersa nucleopolyhedrovirus]|uniref:p49 n=1 Tax=Euproctis pseudoconspersa nucleopolyhedrovirus TaxID=307467 RepID=C3TWS1_9ABAC|nr:p49 [Euproctis pseudoconspersa nucleopolyhedrovirus]ACO53463.1 p49 [Euproctis pseudoconspersa nucleopolyhedrovirus]
MATAAMNLNSLPTSINNDSILDNKISLDYKNMKYLFAASYFNVIEYLNFSAESKTFIGHYLRNDFNKLNESSLLKFLNYLSELKIHNVLLDNSVNLFKYIKPQFKFVCQRNNLDILVLDTKIYVRPDTPIYATNFFVNEPGKFRTMLYREFSKVFDDRHFVSNSETYCLMNGNVGYIFEEAYLDWHGVRMCKAYKHGGTNEIVSKFPYRLYLVGDAMAKHFTENNVVFSNTNDYSLKNYHKGLTLYPNNYKIINSKKFNTRKPNQVFAEIRSELNSQSAYVKFVQRDYIFDANFPDDLLEFLSEYITDTSVYKFVTKFEESQRVVDNETEQHNLNNEIIVDRYAVNKFRKLNVKKTNDSFAVMTMNNNPPHIMMRPDMIQIKGTLNAFYVPSTKVFGILAKSSLFGSTELLEFSPFLLQYAHHSPPKRLGVNSYVVDVVQKIYLTQFTFAGSVSAYLLVRGDFESYENSFKSLKELKNAWVYNTLLKLFITSNFVNRSIELSDYRLRNNF